MHEDRADLGPALWTLLGSRPAPDQFSNVNSGLSGSLLREDGVSACVRQGSTGCPQLSFPKSD